MPLREDNGFRMDPAEVGALVTDRTKLLILNTPHNPCGSALSREDVEALAAIAVERDLFVLSDEVYWAIRYGGAHISIATLPGMDERTILLDGCSKTFAMTGWRLGMAALPAPLVAAVHAPDHQHGVVHVRVQRRRRRWPRWTAPGNPSKRWWPSSRSGGRDRRRPERIPGITCQEPGGAFYVFPNVTGIGVRRRRPPTICYNEAGVACLDGDGVRPAGQGYVRF